MNRIGHVLYRLSHAALYIFHDAYAAFSRTVTPRQSSVDECQRRKFSEKNAELCYDWNRDLWMKNNATYDRW